MKSIRSSNRASNLTARTRLYLSPILGDPCQSFGRLQVRRHGLIQTFIIWTLTVIRDSHGSYLLCGQGLTTYQWRALPTELHRHYYALTTFELRSAGTTAQYTRASKCRHNCTIYAGFEVQTQLHNIRRLRSAIIFKRTP